MVEQQFGESKGNINDSDLKIRFSAVKMLIPHKHKVVADVKRADGSQTHTRHKTNEAHADYFCVSFGSTRKPFRKIVERERKALGERIVAARDMIKEKEVDGSTGAL